VKYGLYRSYIRLYGVISGGLAFYRVIWVYLGLCGVYILLFRVFFLHFIGVYGDMGVIYGYIGLFKVICG